MLKCLLPNEVKVKFISDGIRLRSNLTIVKTIRFTIKSLFCRSLGFTHSHSGILGDVERFVQLIAGTN